MSSCTFRFQSCRRCRGDQYSIIPWNSISRDSHSGGYIRDDRLRTNHISSIPASQRECFTIAKFEPNFENSNHLSFSYS